MGESDLVLDTMSVEDVLKLVGDKPGDARASRAAAPPSRATGERTDRAPAAPASNDWRETLRSTGGAPESEELAMGAKKPATVPEQIAPASSAAESPQVPLSQVPPGIVVGKPAAFGFGDIAALPSLDAIADMVRKCTRCPLYQTAKQGVPGEGNPNARFVCVGEAPGATEDETGRPFVGAAGQLLTKILAAIGLPREDVFICNVIKHRPPGNRNPLPNEIAACSPYLVRQLELIQPGVILALGTFAAQTLLETKESIGKLRGRVHRYHGIPLVVTYHPAALLRNPSWKRPTWDDVQLARRILDSSPLTGA
jgi:uracil-DNA glycosylase family 4